VKEMREIEKQAHLFERLEKTFDAFILENELSRISVLGSIDALKLKIVKHWEAQDCIDTQPEEDENDEELVD